MLKITALILILITPLTFATETQEELDTKCTTYEKVAKMTMEYRQLDLPMSDLVKMAGGNKLTRKLAILAYKEPSWSTQERKDKAVSEFMNKVTLLCYQGESK